MGGSAIVKLGAKGTKKGAEEEGERGVKASSQGRVVDVLLN